MRTAYRQFGELTTMAVIILSLLCTCPADVWGQETTDIEADPAENEIVHAVGLFVGATTMWETRDEETYFTLAAEYEYQSTKLGKWGIAGVVEAIFADKTEFLLLPLAYYHFHSAWFARAGLGLEVAQSESDHSMEVHAIVRIGVGYSIPVGDFLLVPSLDVDGIRSDPAVVYGLVIAKEF